MSPRSPGVATLLQHGSAARTEESIQEALNRVVLDSIPPVSVALALLYAILTVAYATVFPPALAAPLAFMAGGTALCFAAIRAVFLRWKPPASAAHPIGALLAATVLLDSLLHLYLTSQANQTTDLILLVLGLGIVFLDVGWFAVLLSAVFAGWFLVVSTVPLTSPWIHFGFALAGAAALSSAVLVIRIRTFRRLEELHFDDRMTQLELESALSRTETARKGEEEARRALEEAVERLRESEDRFRRLAEASSEGVLLHHGGKIVDASTRAEEILGRPATELLGRHIADLVASDDRERVRRFLDTDEGADPAEGASLEVEGVRGDDSRFPMELEGGRGREAREGATVTLVRDVTEERRAEELLRAAATEAETANRAKSAFLANMSHELRTPLNAVIGFANVLRKNRSGNLNDSELEYLRRITSNGEHLLKLIGEVLDLSKIEAGRMDLVTEPVDLGPLLLECTRSVEMEARRKGLDLVLDTPADLPPLETDPQRLRQILLNLLGNAVKFTPEGQVAVRVVVDEEDGRPARIEVEDTGIGIPGERLEEIFEAFRQADAAMSRRFGGTGLGLTISQSLCEILGFRLWVTSEEGRGSTFAVDLRPPPERLPMDAPSAKRGVDGSDEGGTAALAES